MNKHEIDKSIKRYSRAVIALEKCEMRMGEAIHVGRKMEGGIRAYCKLIGLNVSEAQRLLRGYRESELFESED